MAAIADTIGELENLLRNRPQIQEKIYVHMDNSCYFTGDTLWYKAYVVRADNLQPTDMSKLMYVELLTPDGYLVDRQHVVVNGNGYTCGQFVLEDSLYSGYYELRAYTRWQLNFNMTEREYFKSDREMFFNQQACEEYFRDWEGLYSRVFPVYEKPKEAGNYKERYMVNRPKQRVLIEKQSLKVEFYPEGGHLIKGVPCNLAFEVTDDKGQALDVTGMLSDGTVLKPEYQGRGHVMVTPGEERLKATFEWEGKSYSFKLPEVQNAGVGMVMDRKAQSVKLTPNCVTMGAWAVLCRGKVVDFRRMTHDERQIDLRTIQLPTGINEIIVYDTLAQPLASRLFFVNNHDLGKRIDVKMTANGETVDAKTTLMPYEPVSLEVTNAQLNMSLAVRDASTDQRGYDDGNIMTDMLLSSELKGFVAKPAYYFESDDDKHSAHLDLLMLVQGWHAYQRVDSLRFMPETMLTYEGTLYNFPSNVYGLDKFDIQTLGVEDSLVGPIMPVLPDFRPIQIFGDSFLAFPKLYTEKMRGDGITLYGEDGIPIVSKGPIFYYSPYNNDGFIWSLKHKKFDASKCMVEGEIVKGKDVAGAKINLQPDGKFFFGLPPFYDYAYLFIKAYSQKDSLKLSMDSFKDKGRYNEEEQPDYYIKRNVFFPMFTKPYSWYQINSPELSFVDEEDDVNIPENSRLAGNHLLQTVVVKAKRRGRRAIDYSKPALVMDVYDAYNMVTDYGLSFGIFDMKRFPGYLAEYLFGNMGSPERTHVLAYVDKVPFWLNYLPEHEESVYVPHATSFKVFDDLHLKRLNCVKVYTDYDKRNNTGNRVETTLPGVTFVFQTMDEGSKRPTYRDRRYLFDGIAYAESFYSPDYSERVPAEPTDYRRTLYWNPNVPLNPDGTFKTIFYNNSRQTRVTVSAAGINASGQMFYY